MKKSIAIAATMVVLGLVGCGTDRPAPVLPMVTMPLTVDRPVTQKELLIAVVHNEIPWLTAATDDQLIGLAKTICDSLDANATQDDILDIMRVGSDGVFTDYQVGFIYGASVQAMCPQYAP